MFVKRSVFFEDKPTAPTERSGNKSVCADAAVINDTALSEQLRCLREMCVELNRAELVTALDNAERRISSGFTAAVFGHGAIGKNARINGIAGKEIFPESLSDEEYRRLFGGIPTVIRDGEDGITLRHGRIPQKKASFPLTGEGWKSAAVFAAKNASRAVEVSVSGTFLSENGIGLVRTDLDGDISACDCAAELTSAIQLLGEREMLALRNINGRVPFIAAAVMHMDSLNDTERGQILSYAEKKLGDINGEIALLTEGDIDMRVREYIISRSQSAELAERKTQCIRRDLSEIRGDMATIYSALLSELTERGRQTAAKAERRKSDAAEATKKTWDILETEMMKKSSERFEWVYNRVTEARDELLERFRFEAEHTNDPKDWLENVYPYRMKQEMKTLTRSLEINLKNSYISDTDWLNRQVKAKFGAEISSGYSTIADMGAVPSESMGTSMRDIKKVRIGARAVAGAAAIVGYLAALGPLAPAISISGGLVAELFLGKKISEQRKALITRLNSVIPAELNRRLGEVENNLRELYKNAVSSARAAYEDTLEKQAAEIDGQTAAKSANDIGAVYNNRIEQLKKLKTEE